MKNMVEVKLPNKHTVEMFESNNRLVMATLDANGYGLSHENLSKRQVEGLKKLVNIELKNNYFIILAFTNDIKKYPHRKDMEDIPSYLANYDLNINKGMVIQSNIYDSIKFESEEDANLFMNKAKENMPEWEFEIVDINKLIFGKKNHKFVYKKVGEIKMTKEEKYEELLKELLTYDIGEQYKEIIRGTLDEK